MQSRTSQRGMSLISGLLIAIIVGFIGLIAVRLFPVYYDYFVVSSVFNHIESDARGKSPAAIRETIERRFEVNEVNVVSIKDVKITPARGGGSDVSLHYEERVPFLANLGLVATFDKQVEVPGH
ncbi:MAG TPA: DUF4845 domain-containing protein [Gammaproteobacteria bacterium]|nr:DUF4845 domain-containing protein [Gammaproteobacteria bacterium]